MEARNDFPNLRPDGVSRLLITILDNGGRTPSLFRRRIAQAGQRGYSAQTNYRIEAGSFLARAFPFAGVIWSEDRWMTDNIPDFTNQDSESNDWAEENVMTLEDPLVSLELVEAKKTFEDWKNGGRCEQCDELFPGSQMVQCDHGHKICTSCVTREVECLISEGVTEFGCPSMNCSGCIEQRALATKIPHSLWKRVIEFEAERVMFGSRLEGIVHCAHCGFMCIFEGLGAMICPECGLETCSNCQAPAHKGSCSRLDQSHQAEEAATDELIAACPECKRRFVREVGCNKMTCPVCNTQVCNFCHERIPVHVGYSHFWSVPGEVCPPNQCPLWT
jgi:hypothetical protein